ncbi:hypothetical protein [Mangrovibrevibacter kandeliae]|uniref:hypothetical protein n=1 Tax=Mangrovibrevibacter kandeliae TaxID=2968473 RepID=UPI002118D79D|nr:hypothetical protein [Aurantimonas sp. CSK15Z-1]MCQ8781750.1 hypothetical protein [Aurantimonas sp. CSK15Z-1]
MTLPTLPGADRLSPYRRRRARPLGLRTVREHQLKLYALEAEGQTVERSVLHAALAVCDDALAAPPPLGLVSHGLGFLILHAGEDATWLLVQRWVDGGILCRWLFRAATPSPSTFEPLSGSELGFCVWEGAIIDWERRAFVETLMTPDPDPAAYLSRQLAGYV